MQTFTNKNAIEDWLAPMDYQGFWAAIAPYDLILQPRDHCDQQIRDGEVDEATVLDVLKYLAVIELGKRHGLHYRCANPGIRLVRTSD